MENHTVIVPERVFRTWLMPAALVLCILAAGAGIPLLIVQMNPEYRQFLARKLIASGITDHSSLITWSMIHYLISGACVICPGVLATGLAVTLRGKPARGFGFLSSVSGCFFGSGTARGSFWRWSTWSELQCM